MKKRSLLYVNIAVLLFGLAGLFAKWISLPSIWITFGRVVFSSICLHIVMIVRKESFRTENRRDLMLLLLAGAVLALHWWAFLESIKVSTVAIGTITFSAFPLFVTFLEPLVMKEKLRLRNIITAAVILIGVLITIPEVSLENDAFLGIVIGLISSVAYAVFAVMNRYLSGRYSGVKTAFFEQFTAAVVLLPVVILTPAVPSAKDIMLLLLLGVVTTALAHTLFISALKNVPASIAGIFSSLETVYGILFAFIFLQEVPSLREIIGGLIIIFAVTLSQIVWKRE